MIPSSDPWAVLGLDRDASTERDVKRAYARLLKLHRPDQDPEGFRRANDAYQRALKALAQGAATEVDGGDSEIPPATTVAGQGRTAASSEDAIGSNGGSAGENGGGSETEASARSPTNPRRLEDFPDLPQNFLTAFENLKRRLSLVGGAPEVPEFNVLRNMVREDASLAAPWVAVLETLFSTECGLQLLPQLHPQDVLLLMLRGESSCAARIVLSWRDDSALVNRLTQLANLMLDRKVGNDPAMLGALHFTAKLTAFHLPHVSARLADELYRKTGPGTRGQIVREIEVRSSAGKVFSILPHPQRRFWEHQLFESGDGETDWTVPENAAALKIVLLNCDQAWEGWPIVAQLVPREVLDESLRRERLAQAERNTRESRRYVRAHPGSAFLFWLSRWRQWVPSGRWIFVSLWLVGHLVSVVARSGSSSHSPSSTYTFPSPPPSSFHDAKGSSGIPNPKSREMQDFMDRNLGTKTGDGAKSSSTTTSSSSSTIEAPSLEYRPSAPEQSSGTAGFRLGN